MKMTLSQYAHWVRVRRGIDSSRALSGIPFKMTVNAAAIVKLKMWAHTVRGAAAYGFFSHPNLVKINVQVASGFPPGPAIGLSLP